jgi:hypothetical protein
MDLVESKLKSELDYMSQFEHFKKRITLFVEEKNLEYGSVIEPMFICAKDHKVVKEIVFGMAKKLN